MGMKRCFIAQSTISHPSFKFIDTYGFEWILLPEWLIFALKLNYTNNWVKSDFCVYKLHILYTNFYLGISNHYWTDMSHSDILCRTYFFLFQNQFYFKKKTQFKSLIQSKRSLHKLILTSGLYNIRFIL